MIFSSAEYLIFLTITVLIFHLIPDKHKSVFLLIASYLFYYIVNPVSPLILLLTTMTGYFFAIKTVKNNAKTRNLFLFSGILINVIILIVFRYFNGIIHFFNISASFEKNTLISSIGVSFFTFQNISYLIDCYLEKTKPEKNFFDFALYLAFFPKLLQGPIERASSLIPQLKNYCGRDYQTFRLGAQLFIWGMFKKVVIADNLMLIVNNLLKDINGCTSLSSFLLPFFYAIQIYCDFSGYTDMALGSAKFFGINLTDNFHFPYYAKSIQDFWRRWHITLSRWLFDYIFNPLQMKCRNYGNYGIVFSLMVTFLVCGMWHGLTINYITWGLFHGILLSISFLTYKKWDKFCKKNKFNKTVISFINVFVTFNLVCLSWLIFMTKSLPDAVLILSKASKLFLSPASISLGGNKLGAYKEIYLFALLLLTIDFLQMKFNIKLYFDKQNVFIRWFFYYLIIILIFIYKPNDAASFIYFQF